MLIMQNQLHSDKQVVDYLFGTEAVIRQLQVLLSCIDTSLLSISAIKHGFILRNAMRMLFILLCRLLLIGWRQVQPNRLMLYLLARNISPTRTKLGESCVHLRIFIAIVFKFLVRTSERYALSVQIHCDMTVLRSETLHLLQTAGRSSGRHLVTELVLYGVI